MKATFAALGGQISIEVEGNTTKELFEKLADVQEIFGAAEKCGACGSVNIRLRSRKVDDFQFHEMYCESCSAAFSFGQKKVGAALFPRRKDEHGHQLPNGGWIKWEQSGSNEQPTPRSQQASTSGAPATDGELQRMLAGVKDRQTLKAAVETLYELLCKERGDDAALGAFTKLHEKYGIDDWREVADRNQARRFVADLWALAKKAPEQKQ